MQHSKSWFLKWVLCVVWVLGACSEGSLVSSPDIDTGGGPGPVDTETGPVDTGTGPVDTGTGTNTTDPDDTDTSDTGLPDVGTPCTPENAADICGEDEFCVDGYCCDEECDGDCAACNVAGAQGTCTLLGFSTVCRPADGDCDVPERCDGASTACPADEVREADYACGTAPDPTDLCDARNTCDGVNKTCQVNSAAVGTVCDVISDNDCQNSSTCDGGGACVPEYVAVGTACTGAGSECKVNPVCDGTGLCGSDTNQPDGTVCGDATVNDCVLESACVSGVCVPQYESAGTACGDSTETECDLADTCDGAGICQPNLVPSGESCGDSTSDPPCNLPDTCDGDGVCQPNLAAAGTACGDSTETECDLADTCDATGVCNPNYVDVGTSCGRSLENACALDACDGVGDCEVLDAVEGQECGTPIDEFRCTEEIACGAGAETRELLSFCQAGICTPDDTIAWTELETCDANTEICIAGETSAYCSVCDENWAPDDICDPDTPGVLNIYSGISTCLNNTCDPDGYTLTQEVCEQDCVVDECVITCHPLTANDPQPAVLGGCWILGPRDWSGNSFTVAINGPASFSVTFDWEASCAGSGTGTISGSWHSTTSISPTGGNTCETRLYITEINDGSMSISWY